jgi:hypothetical protein
MFAPAAAALSLLSSLSLAISSVEDPVRASLQATAEHLSDLVSWATVAVALGVAFEMVEIVHAIVGWTKQKRRERREAIELQELAVIFPSGEVGRETKLHSDDPKWMKLLLRIGIIIVVVGVVGEWRFGTELEDAHNDIHKYDVQKLTSAERIAGDAASSAKIAHEEALAVAKLAAAQGPRAKLLAKVASELAGKLASFAGERVGLFVCGRQGTPDQETLDTWGAIANILGADVVSGTAGAKWKEVPTNLNFADGCGAARGLGQGVIVFVSKRASRRTLEAANALGHGLADALPPSPNKMPSLIDPDFAKLTVDRGYQDKNAPWVAVALDPDLITVLIGAHP